MDGASIGDTSAAPYELDWSAAGLGEHTLSAIAYDNDGASTESEPVSVTVIEPLPDTEAPIVTVTVSPQLGYPLLAGRVYDSRNLDGGSFGPGWSLPHEGSNVQAEFTYEPSEGWGEDVQGGLFSTYILVSYSRKVLALRLGEGVFKFRMEVTPKTSFMRPIMDNATPLTVSYVPVDDTKGTLDTPNDSSQVLLYSDNDGTLAYADEDNFGEPYNPTLFRLTLEDGSVYMFDTHKGLLSMTDPYGHAIEYSDDGISHSSGASLSFERDTSSDRIERIVDELGRTIEYQYDEDGMLEQVIQKGSGSYAARVLENYAYNKGLNEVPVLKDIIAPDGTRLGTFEYDSQGRKTGLIDHEGNRVLFGYDAPEHHYTVTDRRGNPTSYSYDSDGNVTGVTDAEGNSESYSYDEDGNVLAKTNKLGYTTAYSYDEDGNKLTETDPLGNTTSYSYDEDGNTLTETDRLGHTTSFTYDEHGNRLSKTDALGQSTTYDYDADGLKTSETDALGYTTSYTYTPQGKMATKTDPLGNTSVYTYDSDGNTLTSTDPLGNTTSSEYDWNGNVTREIDASGHSVTYTYDAQGHRISTTDALGSTSRSEYDPDGKLLSRTNALGQSTSFSYDPNGNTLSQSTARSTFQGMEEAATQFVYDFANRQIETIDPAGNSTRTEYNAEGWRTAVVDPLGNRTAYAYDAAGRLLSTTSPDGTSSRVSYDAEGRTLSRTDRAGRVTSYSYDELGRKISTTYPDGTTTSTEYGPTGKVLSVTDARGNTTSYTYEAECNCSSGRRATTADALGHVTSYEYDANGNTVAVTDANGHTTEFEYDSQGRKVKNIFADGSSATVEYDAAGRKIAETDQAGATTSFAYDALGRLLSVTDALGQVTRYEYDEAGNTIAQTDANGRTTRFAYDILGWRVSRTLPLGMTETMTYDAAGNLLSTTDFNGDTIGFDYDSRHRLRVKTFPDGSSEQYSYTPAGAITTVTDNRGTTAYEYDLRDRLLRQSNPDGSTLSYSYDANGNRTDVTTASGTTVSTYDALNRLATVTDPDGGVTSYTYDAVGNKTRVDAPNLTSSTYEYDTLNRLRGLEHRSSSGELLASFSYTLNPDGSRAQVAEQSGRTVSYSYDALKRLTDEQIVGTSGETELFQYSYDAVGNRLSKTHNGATVSYTYDANDRLLTEDGATYSYDNNGNTLSLVKSQDTANYAYDAQNRLVRAEIDRNGESSIAEYLYDHDGIRIRKILNSVERTDYVVDKNRPYAQVLEERDSTGALRASYVYGTDLLSQQRTDTPSYYLYDGLGSTRALTDASGVVTDTYTYEAYGTLLEQQGTTENAYLYTGEQYDPTLEWYYLRARYMNPAIDRFMTMDSFEGSQNVPLSLHKYFYAHGNPVNYVDPSGHFVSLNEALATVAIIGIATTIPGDARLPMISSSTSGSCGPEVSESVDNTLKDIQRTFAGWGGIQKYAACHKLYMGPDSLILGASTHAWDINPLRYIGASAQYPSDIWGKQHVTNGSKPRCEWNVAYRGQCVNAGYLNFIMWGAINRLCHETLDVPVSIHPAIDSVSHLWTLSRAQFWASVWKKYFWLNWDGARDVKAIVEAGYNHPTGGGSFTLPSGMSHRCKTDPSNKADGRILSWRWQPCKG